MTTRGTNRWTGRSAWLAVGLLLGLAGGRLLTVPPASAQIPDSGAQRNAMLVELRAANAKLDAFYELVASGKVKVRVADDKAEPASRKPVTP